MCFYQQKNKTNYPGLRGRGVAHVPTVSRSGNELLPTKKPKPKIQLSSLSRQLFQRQRALTNKKTKKKKPTFPLLHEVFDEAFVVFAVDVGLDGGKICAEQFGKPGQVRGQVVFSCFVAHLFGKPVNEVIPLK